MWWGGFLGTALFVCSSWFSRLEFGFGLDCGFPVGGFGCVGIMHLSGRVL